MGRTGILGSDGRFGRYRVGRRIGAGGMSQAWRGQLEGETGFRKLVVIKVLHPEFVDDPSFVRMFTDEARLMGRLSHPNIAQVYDAGVESGTPYLIMEHVDGPDLAQVAKRLDTLGQRPLGLIAQIMADVARGLSAAHTATDERGRPLGIIHRDVSLGNVVITRGGMPKLIDFGIARWDERATVTEMGQLKGKLHYMAPEQLSARYDNRVDVYQAGVCLYWLCTGRPPFHAGDPLRLWRQRLRGNMMLPSQFVPNFPTALEKIIVKALEASPDARYQSAKELADALEAFANEWQQGSADGTVTDWLASLFTAEEWSGWRPSAPELDVTDPHMQAPQIYDGDEDTGGARVARAFAEGRYLTAHSLACDVMSASDLDSNPIRPEDDITEQVVVPTVAGEVTRREPIPQDAEGHALVRGTVVVSARRVASRGEVTPLSRRARIAVTTVVVVLVALGMSLA